MKSVQCHFDRQLMSECANMTLLRTVIFCDCICCDEKIVAAPSWEIFAESPILGGGEASGILIPANVF